jgi:hypothetical protein
MSLDSVLWRVFKSPLSFSLAASRSSYIGTRGAACVQPCVGAQYLPYRYNSAAAADRTCRHSYDLRSRQGRVRRPMTHNSEQRCALEHWPSLRQALIR